MSRYFSNFLNLKGILGILPIILLLNMLEVLTLSVQKFLWSKISYVFGLCTQWVKKFGLVGFLSIVPIKNLRISK